MADLEKTIRGLECKICPNAFCGNCEYFIRYENNPDTGRCDRDTIYRDALSLLKAQEPRIMTPIDFDDNPMVDENGKLPAWVEYKRYNGVLRSADGWVTINQNWVDGYIDRRFWTSQPSAEQRKDVRWNE